MLTCCVRYVHICRCKYFMQLSSVWLAYYVLVWHARFCLLLSTLLVWLARPSFPFWGKKVKSCHYCQLTPQLDQWNCRQLKSHCQLSLLAGVITVCVGGWATMASPCTFLSVLVIIWVVLQCGWTAPQQGHHKPSDWVKEVTHLSSSACVDQGDSTTYSRTNAWRCFSARETLFPSVYLIPTSARS